MLTLEGLAATVANELPGELGGQFQLQHAALLAYLRSNEDIAAEGDLIIQILGGRPAMLKSAPDIARPGQGDAHGLKDNEKSGQKSRRFNLALLQH